jgi:hypothetical protein
MLQIVSYRSTRGFKLRLTLPQSEILNLKSKKAGGPGGMGF